MNAERCEVGNRNLGLPEYANDNDTSVSESGLGFNIYDSQTGIGRIFESIENLESTDGVVIKMQTWRGDDLGLEAARLCEVALARGADVKLFKDEIGRIFELGERSGKSLWHKDGDNPKLDRQGRLMRRFYQHSDLSSSHQIDEHCSEQRKALQGYSRFEIESESRYDHSKVILIYDKRLKIPTRAFVGGACFGDEWGDQVVDNNFDGVIEITNSEILEQIVLALQGKSNEWQNGIKVLTNNQNAKESYYNTIREHVSVHRGKVEAAIAYMGKADLIKLFEGKSEVRLLMPYESNINKDRNWHFIYEMMRRLEKDFQNGVWGRFEDGRFLSYWWDFINKVNQDIPPDMQLVPLDRMSHLKAIVCESTFAALGSANMVGENAYNEAGLAFGSGMSESAEYGIEQVRFLLKRAAKHVHSESKVEGVGINYLSSGLSGSPQVPRFSLWRSQVEHFGMALQGLMGRFRYNQISKIQAREQAFFCELFPNI